MTSGIVCPVCEGDGQVIWDDGVPRRIRADDPLVVTECPACNRTGVEPSGFGEDQKR